MSCSELGRLVEQAEATTQHPHRLQRSRGGGLGAQGGGGVSQAVLLETIGITFSLQSSSLPPLRLS